tara:strand:- start:418 stop:666 length:249 start_codon:yes stop_codon:yes gene_type:complete
MACSKCKKNAENKVKDLKSGIDSVLDSYGSSIDQQKIRLGDKLMDGSESILNLAEKVGVTIFAWVPLVIGYYHIIKFIIYLF